MSHFPPSTTALRAFLAVAAEGSTARAAEKLHLSQSAVSKKIQALEVLLEATLFERGPRGVKLTEAGELYRPYAESALEQLARGRRRLEERKDRRPPIRLHMLAIVGERWLIERFPAFSAEHPDIDIQFTNYVSETEAEEPDLDIRHGTGHWPGRQAYLLFGRKVVLVAAPHLLERSGGLTSVADIQRMSYLQHFQMPTYWAEFTEAHGLRGAVPAHTVRYGYLSVVIRAAMSGLGLALVAKCFVRDELESGALVNPLELSVDSALGFWLTMPEGREHSAELRVFADWVRREAALFSSE
ncbi:MAG: LysR family transcriptional regulator [Methylobacterium sp.]|nr:MAG: LysR family transcriptional regulator [Methylobacterium sp.]